MNILRILSLSALVTLSFSIEIAEAGSPKPVAIIYSLKGEATLLESSRRPLRLFDRLPAGITLEVGSSSRLALAFSNGRRYELGEGSRVKLGAKDLASQTGPVHSLPRVPSLPRLTPIAENDHPGPSAAAVRIRGEEIEILSPENGSATLADATILHFQDAAATRHQIEIEDVHGAVIYRSVVQSPTVRVPAGSLSPGARYHWIVKALDKPGPAVRGEADFVTLSRRDAQARERLHKAIETLEDGDSRALLTAVDHDLRLTSEAPGNLEETGGAVIESVAPGSTGETAGLRPGDLISSWSCPASLPALPQPSSGRIRSPYDLLPLEIEEAPRHAAILHGKRGDQEMTWRLTASEWGIESRPYLPDDLNKVYLEGKGKIEAGDFSSAERSWRSAVESARTAGESRLAAWLLHRLATALAKAGKWPEADAAYGEALIALERETGHPAVAQLLRNWEKTFERRGLWDAADERYRKALALDRAAAPKSLDEAHTLNALGIMTAKRGDYSTAKGLLQQALALREELAPGTAEVTGSLNNLGILAGRSGDGDAAEEYLKRGEEIQRRLAPESANHALFFQNLGNLVGARGDLEGAEDYYRHALTIFEKTNPGGDSVVDNLHNLANVAIQRGDLTVADDLLQRSLALQARRAPDQLGISTTLLSLGNLASRRGALETAEAHYRQALAIQEKLSPEGLDVASSLASLGIVAALRGDFTTAQTYLERSLAIKEKLTPGGLGVAAALERLGRLESDRGVDLVKAEELLSKALTIYETQAPTSLDTSDVLRGLGNVEIQRGRMPEALSLYQRALDLQRRLAPESTGEAEALYFLGRAERRAGRSREGTRDLCGAIDVLDRQRARIGNTEEARTSFEATLGDYYHACLEGLIELGRPAEAFHALERAAPAPFSLSSPNGTSASRVCRRTSPPNAST